MKRIFCFVLAIAMLVSLTACKKEETTGFYQSLEEINSNSIASLTTPSNMVAREGAVRVTLKGDDGGQSVLIFKYDGTLYEANQIVDYASGDHVLMYFNSEQQDAYFYTKTNDEIEVQVMTDASKDGILNDSIFSLKYYTCEITEAIQEGDQYVVTMTLCEDTDVVYQELKLWIDPEYGYVEKAQRTTYQETDEPIYEEITFEYLKDVEIDTSPKDDASEDDLPDNWYLDDYVNAEETEVDEDAVTRTGTFNFATTTLDGEAINFNGLGESRIYIIYFFDPAAEDCAEQLGILQDLYTDYGKENVNVMAMLCEDGDVDAAKAAAKRANVSYYVTKYNDWMAVYTPREFPGAIVVNYNGDLVSDEPMIGSYTYREWEEFAKSYLNAD